MNNKWSIITNILECEEADLNKYFEKHVCIYCSTPEGNIIIYWEPDYGGFRGTYSDCGNNWPES